MTATLSPPTVNDMLVLARESLACYALAMSPAYQLPPHVKMTIAHLEAVERGEEPRSIVVMPPRHSKSETCSKLFPAWALGRRPQLQIISIGYGQELADDVGRKVRNLLADPRHSAIFPSCRLSSDSTSAHRFATTIDGNFFAIGRGGAITGRGANVLIVDDLFKDGDEARSPGLRRSIRQWFGETVMTRLLPGGVIILVGTRWHSDDLIGSLLREHPESGWTVLSFPAIAEHDESFRKEGEALWPQMYPLSYLEGQRRILGVGAFSSLFQQRPVLEEGAIFKAEQFRFYEGNPPQFQRIVLSFDTAYKLGADNDYSACSVWGATEHEYYLLYAWRARVEFPELRQMVKALVKQWRPAATLVEDSASGQPLIQELKRNPELQIVPVRPKGDKVSRAHSITPLIESGAVLVPGSSPWRDMYLEELQSFPNGVHDDLVDSTTQALLYLRDNQWNGGMLEILTAAWGPSNVRETDPYRRADMVELPDGYSPVQIRPRRG
jgi:predicted phage terminase large subunit-like protein